MLHTIYKCFILVNSLCFQSDIKFFDNEKEAIIQLEDKELHFFKVKQLKDGSYICSEGDPANQAKYKYKYSKDNYGYKISVLNTIDNTKLIISNKYICDD